MIWSASSTTQAIDGDAANLSGVRFESDVRRELKAHNFEFISPDDYYKHPEKYSHLKRIALPNVPYESIYGHHSRMEFLLIIKGYARDILVQAKQQNVSGSVDEKLPYIYANALKNLPQQATLFVYSGNGWKRGAIKWVRGQADETDGFYAMSFTEFTEWLKDR